MSIFEYPTIENIQDEIENVLWTEVYPTSYHEDSNCLNFEFKLAENEFWFMNDTTFYTRMKIIPCKSDKHDFQHYTPIQYLSNTIFSQALLLIDGCPVVKNDFGTFGYKAWLETSLAFSRSAKQGHLSAGMWYDSAEKRKKRANSGKEFGVSCHLNFDLTHQPRPIPGGSKIEIRLTLAKPQFYLNCAIKEVAPRIKLLRPYIDVPRTIVSRTVVDSVSSQLRQGKLRLPFMSTEIRTFPIYAQSLESPLEVLCNGKLPQRCFAILVDTKAMNGDYMLDPFNIKHFNVNYLACFIDGIQYPSRHYSPNFKELSYDREYNGLIHVLNQNNTESICEISYDDYAEHPIFAFSFAPETNDPVNTTNKPKFGQLRIQLKFSEPTNTNLHAIVYLEYDSKVAFTPNNIFLE